MEFVLHVETMQRSVKPPLHIGTTELVEIGEAPSRDGLDSFGDAASSIVAGNPISTGDVGSNLSNLSFVKTLEFGPDMGRDSGNQYVENTYILTDQKYIIPVRTKILSGRSQGVRASHLPSLNAIRSVIDGTSPFSSEVRSPCVTEFITHDKFFQDRNNRIIADIVDEHLITVLERCPIIDTAFSGDAVSQFIQRTGENIINLDYDPNPNQIAHLIRASCLDCESVPSMLLSNDVVAYKTSDIRDRLATTAYTQPPTGALVTNSLPNIDHNPVYLREIIDVIDGLPVTDLNVEIIAHLNGEILNFNAHVVGNRIAAYVDSGYKGIDWEYLVSNLIDANLIRLLRRRMAASHPSITDEHRHYMRTQPLKFKIVKSFLDELVILVYRYNSTSEELPLCGVHFDLATNSLAPITTMGRFNFF